jgi:energy-coupling factor transporter ATP-binding protein EcfA2
MTVAYPIELRNVTFSYPGTDRPCLKSINLQVREGEFVGITGATACGKSTLLLIMSGAIPHYLPGDLQGDVLIYGERTQDLSLARITGRIGLVMQDPESQLFNLFVRDEIVWGMENRGIPREAMVQRLGEALSFYAIEHLPTRVTYDLSGGEKQKVALAAIHATKPAVFLFDNPTSQLDPIGSAMVFEAIRRITLAREHTVVMVEDKIDQLLEHADRLILMRDGEITLNGPPQEFCQRRDLLDEAHVRPSQVVDLAYELQAAGVDVGGLPLTLEAAEQVFGALLNSRRRQHVG